MAAGLTWFGAGEVLLRAEPVELVRHEDEWHFFKGTEAPPTGWQSMEDAALEPTAWQSGPGGFGYAGAEETEDCGTLLPDMEDGYTTLYYRRTFTLNEAADAELHLMLRMDWDDGFIAWLDGVYLDSRMVEGAPAEPTHTATASGNHESSRGGSGAESPEQIDLGPVAGRLGPGDHVLAVMGLNVSDGSSDFIQVSDLWMEAVVEPPAGTVLGGVLTTNRMLGGTNRVYTVADHLTVADGATLTVEPGVTLQFGDGRDLRVAAGGRLLAEGTADEPIRFLGSPKGSGWGGVEIDGNASSPESRLVFVHMEHNRSTAIHGTDASLFLDHLHFGSADRQFVSLDRCSFVVSHCFFPETTASIEPVHGTGGIKPGGHGLFLRNYFGPITGYRDTIDFAGCQRPGPILQVIGNVFAGTGDDHLDIDNNDAWVEGNIFLHVHKNGPPDTASAISGGNDSGQASEVTIVGNIFYDVDQAALAKQDNVFVFLNNTIFRQTHEGGLDTEGAVICTQDNNMSEGKAVYLEDNIIVDADALTRDHEQALVTFTNNLMQLTWDGPGGNNRPEDPGLAYVPQLAETTFENWADAQILWVWFSLRPDAAARGAGANGRDIGATTGGIHVSGMPTGITLLNNATLQVSGFRTGSGIDPADWPEGGAGYTHYQWRLDGGPWSGERPIDAPLALDDLAEGDHWIEVAGRNDAGWYRNDPRFGPAATTTIVGPWTVGTDNDEDTMPDSWERLHGLDPARLDATADRDGDGSLNGDEWKAGTLPDDPTSVLRAMPSVTPDGEIAVTFEAAPWRTYTLEYRDSLDSGAWRPLRSLLPKSSSRSLLWPMPLETYDAQGYLRLRTPATTGP